MRTMANHRSLRKRKKDTCPKQASTRPVQGNRARRIDWGYLRANTSSHNFCAMHENMSARIPSQTPSSSQHRLQYFYEKNSSRAHGNGPVLHTVALSLPEAPAAAWSMTEDAAKRPHNMPQLSASRVRRYLSRARVCRLMPAWGDIVSSKIIIIIIIIIIVTVANRN